MRGYFGIGVEQVNKVRNVGALFRTAHAFGAGFVFTVAANYARPEGGKADTSDSLAHLPFYGFPDIEHMVLPEGCKLVGIELTPDAIELPSFHHPKKAAYILGPERGSLSEAMVARCDYVLKIPTKFCINVSLAGGIVMYDRVQSLGRFAPRPMREGGPTAELPDHRFGGPIIRTAMETYREPPPLAEVETYEGEGRD